MQNGDGIPHALNRRGSAHRRAPERAHAPPAATRACFTPKTPFASKSRRCVCVRGVWRGWDNTPALLWRTCTCGHHVPRARIVAETRNPFRTCSTIWNFTRSAPEKSWTCTRPRPAPRACCRSTTRMWKPSSRSWWRRTGSSTAARSVGGNLLNQGNVSILSNQK